MGMSDERKKRGINWWRVATAVFAVFFIGNWIALPRLGSRSLSAEAEQFDFLYRLATVILYGMGVAFAACFVWLAVQIVKRRERRNV